MIEAILEYRFLQYAIYASLLASIISGLIGVIIVEKKLVMMSGGIAHTSYGGVGFAYFIGIEPILGAFLVSIISSFGIGYIKRKGKTKSDLAIGLFWSLGMALGILFIGLTPGYPPNIQSFLFGNILSINQIDLRMLILTSSVVALVIIPFVHYWKLYAYDEEFAKIQGMNIKFMDYLFFFLIGMSIVSLIKVIGIIMVIALFTAPTAIAELFVKRYEHRMLVTILISMFTAILGILVSYMLDIPTGPIIIIFFVTFYVVGLLIKNLARKHAFNIKIAQTK
jgi:zinc transport system permease protein